MSEQHVHEWLRFDDGDFCPGCQRFREEVAGRTELAEAIAVIEGMDFMVPRGCECHAGQMRRAQEPDEYRAAVLAVLGSTSTEEETTA